MKGVIAKDLYEIFDGKKKILTAVISYVAIVIFVKLLLGNDFSVFLSTIFFPIICVPSMMLLATVSDGKSNYPKYMLTTPVTRSDIINAKYILGIFSLVVNMIILFITLNINNNKPSYREIFILVLLSTIISLFIMAVEFPSFILLGSRGMILNMILSFIWIIFNVNGPFVGLLELRVNTIYFLYSILIKSLLASSLIFLLSNLLTKYFYNKKDFG